MSCHILGNIEVVIFVKLVFLQEGRDLPLIGCNEVLLEVKSSDPIDPVEAASTPVNSGHVNIQNTPSLAMLLVGLN